MILEVIKKTNVIVIDSCVNKFISYNIDSSKPVLFLKAAGWILAIHLHIPVPHRCRKVMLCMYL